MQRRTLNRLIGATLAISGTIALLSCGSDTKTTDVSSNPPPAAISGTIANGITVKVIAFNDFHGNLESPGTFGDDTSVPAAQRPAVGGADFIAAHVARLKAQNPRNVVVGAGDFIGASPLISSLFNDEPAVEALNRIGLEFNAVGNHEFDQGADELLRLQEGGCRERGGASDPNSCKGAEVGTPVPFEGAKFKWLSANVVSESTGKTLLPAYGVKEFDGVKVAFIGMTLAATPTIVTPSGVTGLKFEAEAKTVNALVPQLKAQGIEAIVVLVHEGGFQTGSLAAINACAGNLAGTPIEGIVKQFDDAVDLVISGHTHTAYNCKLSNAKGRPIPVSSASAFGRVLTDIDITLDPRTKDVVATTVTNRLVVRNDPSIVAVAEVTQVVEGYRKLVSPLANTVIGSVSADLPNSRIDAACNMPAGKLIADAQLQATEATQFGAAQIAFMNGGGVRTPGFTFASSPVGEGDGNLTYGEAFTVQPFGNSLVTMSLSAKDLKDLLEEQFAGCLGQSSTATRVMLPSRGFRYGWTATAACGDRVRSVSLTRDGKTEIIVDDSGRIADATKTFRVTVNSFMADGGDGLSTLKRGTDRLGGAQDIDALTAYMAGHKSPKAPYVRGAEPDDAGKARITRTDAGTTCPTGALTP